MKGHAIKCRIIDLTLYLFNVSHKYTLLIQIQRKLNSFKLLNRADDFPNSFHNFMEYNIIQIGILLKCIFNEDDKEIDNHQILLIL